MTEEHSLEEDFQAWEVFKNKESSRWIFNKLEVALRQGLHAGPAGTAPEKSGEYISRPIYNLYGMSIGAEKFTYEETMFERIINNDIVPPGHFWCEWIDGEHMSIDYEYTGSEWRTRSVWVGEHYSDENLTKFKSWTRVENSKAISAIDLAIQTPFDVLFSHKDLTKKINIEMRGGHVIEAHYRWGNDPFDEYLVGTRVIPVWDNEEAPEGEWQGNLHEDMEKYSASGHLTNIRRGFVIK